MLLKLFRESNPFSQLILSLAVTVVVFTLIFAFSMVLALAIFPLSVEGLTTGLSNLTAENINVLKYLQLVQGIGLFIVPPIILAFLYSSQPTKWLQTKITFSARIALIVFITVIVMLPVINVLAEWNSLMSFPESLKGLENYLKQAEERAAELTELFLKTDTFSGLMFNLLLIAVIPAIGEEFFFRGMLQKHLTDLTKNYHLGIIITAFAFSAFHMQFYGFVPRFLLGALFGYMLVWSRSIWLPVLAHFIYNGFAVVAYFFLAKTGQIEKFEQVGTNAGTWFLSAVAALLVGYLIFMLKKNLKIELSQSVL